MIATWWLAHKFEFVILGVTARLCRIALLLTIIIPSIKEVFRGKKD